MPVHRKKHLILFTFISALFLFHFISGCSKVEEKEIVDKLPPLKFDSVMVEAKADTILKYKINRIITYTKYPVKGRKTIRELDSLYGSEGRNLILTLNRLDSYNLRRGDSLVVPDTIAPLLSFSPFPYIIDSLKEISKIIFVTRRLQAFACYENGVLIKWGPTSTGRRSKQTPFGLFHTNWKSKKTVSTIDEEWVLPFYFNIHNKEGVAFHHFSMPGYPASHACIRLLEKDAEWLYYWAEQWILTKDGVGVRAFGTPVIIFGDYKYGTPPPWKNVLSNPEECSVSVSEISELLKIHLETIKERLRIRQMVKLAIKEEKAARDSVKLAMKM